MYLVGSVAVTRWKARLSSGQLLSVAEGSRNHSVALVKGLMDK